MFLKLRVSDQKPHSFLFVLFLENWKNSAPLQVKYFFYKSRNNSKIDVSRITSNCNETSNPGLARPLSIALIIAVEQPTIFPNCACLRELSRFPFRNHSLTLNPFYISKFIRREWLFTLFLTLRFCHAPSQSFHLPLNHPNLLLMHLLVYT